MTKAKTPRAAKGRLTTGRATASEPTQLPPRSAAGIELDRWNLPVSGPIRAAALEQLGMPDPNLVPSAWGDTLAPDGAGMQAVDIDAVVPAAAPHTPELVDPTPLPSADAEGAGHGAGDDAPLTQET